MKTNLSGVQFTFPNLSVIHVPNGCYIVVPHPNGWICKCSPHVVRAHPSRFACHLLRWRRLGERGGHRAAVMPSLLGDAPTGVKFRLVGGGVPAPRATVEQAQHPATRFRLSEGRTAGG